MSTAHINRLLREFCGALQSAQSIGTVHAELTDLGTALLQDEQARIQTATQLELSCLNKAWQSYLQCILTTDLDVGDAFLAAGTALARLCRNLLAGIIEGKEKIFSVEPLLREVVYLVTSFGNITNKKLLPIQRSLLQTLSNLVAPVAWDDNERNRAHALVKLYLGDDRKSHIILRALDSEDSQCNLATSMLLLNCLRASPRSVSTCLEPVGVRVVARLMDKVAVWIEAPSRTIEEKCFSNTYEIFDSLVAANMHADMYALIGSTGENVSPSQLTFLKLLDGRLQARSNGSGIQVEHMNQSFLVSHLHRVTARAESSVIQITQLKKGELTQFQEDPILPRTLEGCILLTQCLVALAIQETPLEHEREMIMAKDVLKAGPILCSLRDAMYEGKGLIESLIGLFAQLEALLPRQKPLRNLESESKPLVTTESSSELQGFATLKRDIVQLLGLIVYNDRQSQDRLRECGGVHLILSACVADEHNPLMREYGLLAVRNLMMNNPQNQAVVGKMDPIGIVGPDGELRALPDSMQKHPKD